jgi:hypothetical protein
MTSRNYWIVTAAALFLGLVLTGCNLADLEDKPTDQWQSAAYLYQVSGTWRGSYSQTMTLQKLFNMNDEDWNNSAFFGKDVKTKTVVEITQTISEYAATPVSGAVKSAMIFSGADVAEAWALLKPAIESNASKAGAEFTTNDSRRSITTVQNFSLTLSDRDVKEEFFSGLKINQNRNKLKQSATGDTPEFILFKQ